MTETFNEILLRHLFNGMAITRCHDQESADHATQWLAGNKWGNGRCLMVMPLCGPIDIRARLSGFLSDKPGRIDWIVCGGGTGPEAMPMHPEWVRSLRDQCVRARVPFYFVGWGEWYVPEAGQCKVARGLAERFVCRCGESFPALNSFAEHTGEHRAKCADRHFVLASRAGSEKTGRILDGRTWNDVPEPFAPKQ